MLYEPVYSNYTQINHYLHYKDNINFNAIFYTVSILIYFNYFITNFLSIELVLNKILNNCSVYYCEESSKHHDKTEKEESPR